MAGTASRAGEELWGHSIWSDTAGFGNQPTTVVSGFDEADQEQQAFGALGWGDGGLGGDATVSRQPLQGFGKLGQG